MSLDELVKLKQFSYQESENIRKEMRKNLKKKSY